MDFEGSEGDKLDFQGIVETLTFVGEDRSPGRGEIGFFETGGVTILRVDTVKGAGVVDFEIELTRVDLGLEAGDFIFF